MEYIIITNCCLGLEIHKNLCDYKYNQPFVGTLILDDIQYLNLCKNIKEFMNQPAFLNTEIVTPSNYELQTGKKYYVTQSIPSSYPVISMNYLSYNIDIHCIHNDNNFITKFHDRQLRFNETIKNNNYKIINIMTWNALFLKHNNYLLYINKFLENNDKNPNIIFIFLGPKLDLIRGKHYIVDNNMNVNIKRRPNNVNINLNFVRESKIIVEYIKKYL